MRIVVQRVSRASVTANGEQRGSIGIGLVLLAGMIEGDEPEDARWCAHKIARLRVFPDDQDRMNRSVLDVGGGVVLVPNFTVAGNCRKGTRPSFDKAMHPERASGLFDRLTSETRDAGIGEIRTGVFGSHMELTLVNDGPVTLVIDSRSSKGQ